MNTTNNTKRFRIDLWTYTGGPSSSCAWVPQVSVETLPQARGAAEAMADTHVMWPADRWIDVGTPDRRGVVGQARIVDMKIR